MPSQLKHRILISAESAHIHIPQCHCCTSPFGIIYLIHSFIRFRYVLSSTTAWLPDGDDSMESVQSNLFLLQFLHFELHPGVQKMSTEIVLRSQPYVGFIQDQISLFCAQDYECRSAPAYTYTCSGALSAVILSRDSDWHGQKTLNLVLISAPGFSHREEFYCSLNQILHASAGNPYHTWKKGSFPVCWLTAAGDA